MAAESVSEDKQGPYNCVTPCELELKRKRTWKVDFTLDGYKPVSGLLKPQITGGGVAAGAGNVLIGGLIGVGIDAGTGANLDLRPNPMIAELEPVNSPEMSRILDAEIITEEEAEEAGAAEEVTEESIAAEEAVEIDASPEQSPDEAPAEPDEMDAPAPASDPAVEDEDVENLDSATPSVSAKNVNFDAENADNPLVEVKNEVSGEAAHANVRLYKPGERAPNDEEADALNQMQLEKALSTGD